MTTESRNGIIYIIECLNTKKLYIGKTIQGLKKRFNQHCNSESKCRSLSAAIKEHGRANFTISVLWEGNIKELDVMEKQLIAKYNTIEPNGYNIMSGGNGGDEMSNECIKRMQNKQREISKRRNGLLGSIIKNQKSWCFKACMNKKRFSIRFNTEKEAIEAQKSFTTAPDEFEIPKPRRVGNGKGCGDYINYDKSRNKWMVSTMVDNRLKNLGRYNTEKEAKDILEKFKRTGERPEKLKTYSSDGKTCSKCDTFKCFNEFHKGGNKDGYRSECKECVKNIRRKESV